MSTDLKKPALPAISDYSCDMFSSLESLIADKHRAGVSIGVVIPAQNEEKTIGSIVSAARLLKKPGGLLDELIVIDGTSCDKTAQIARDAGADVYSTTTILPGQNYPDGKGTSLWKSLFVAKSDIVIYIDADITDFDVRFITGLAGALIANPDLSLVKAYYERPFIRHNAILKGEGGRVTEICVRPLLSLWYPELALVRQPLAGEFAFRRSSLLKLPFSSGYGVELRLLLSTYRQFGLGAIGQVNMGERRHRNRTVFELGRMSVAIMSEFFRFLSEDGKVSFHDQPGAHLISPDDASLADIIETTLPSHASLERKG